MPALDSLAAEPLGDGTTLADHVRFVHVYVIEAHPIAPEPSPYTGKVWELEYSDVPQAKTYEDRLANARLTRSLVTGNQLYLVDDLNRDGLVNPVWCTYGTAPNPTYVIDRDGTVVLAQYRTDVDALRPILYALLDAER